MNHDFQAHVTSQAFVLTMSRPMIDLLERIAKHPRGTDEWTAHLNACHALRRRGLIYVMDGGMVRITKEGGLVLELCRCAGLVSKLRAVA